MISHLQRVGDPIVTKFQQSELDPILMENSYHSPEESEEEEEASERNHIIIRDLRWRSDSVRKR